MLRKLAGYFCNKKVASAPVLINCSESSAQIKKLLSVRKGFHGATSYFTFLTIASFLGSVEGSNVTQELPTPRLFTSIFGDTLGGDISPDLLDGMVVFVGNLVLILAAYLSTKNIQNSAGPEVYDLVVLEPLVPEIKEINHNQICYQDLMARISFIEEFVEKQENKFMNQLLLAAKKQLEMISDAFTDIFSNEIVAVPVSFKSGMTYGKFTIKKWLDIHKTCPVTRMALEDKLPEKNISIEKCLEATFSECARILMVIESELKIQSRMALEQEVKCDGPKWR